MKRTSITIAGIAALILSLAIIFLSLSDLPPHFDSGIHKEIGRVMAREALALTKGTGSLIVIKRDTAAFPQPASDVQFKAFKKEITRAKVAIAALQNIQLDPLKPVEVPPGDFLNIIRKAPPGTVIVSFMGPPMLSDEQKKQLKEIHPKIVAFCSGNLSERVNIAELFSQHLLDAAVVSKHSSTEGGKTPATAAFNDLYVSINGSNLDVLKGTLAYAQQ